MSVELREMEIEVDRRTLTRMVIESTKELLLSENGLPTVSTDRWTVRYVNDRANGGEGAVVFTLQRVDVADPPDDDEDGPT